MYESFYGLKWRPFAAAPDPAGYVALGDLRQKHSSLRQCVEASQGIGILTAPAGMGKTLVLRKLLGELRDTFANVLLANSNFASRRALLQAILYELGQPYTNMDEQELRLALTSALRAVRSRRKAVLLAVDEAHLLDDPLLDEIRSVTNLVEHGEPLVRVILCGQLLLEEKLASPSLQALNERVGCHATLEPLSRQETAEYVRQRLRWAGADVAKVFTPDAVESICGISDGVPRCINHLCDHSLLLGYIAETKPVPKGIILEALDELRQLPLQWNEPLVSDGPIESGPAEYNAPKQSGLTDDVRPAFADGAAAIEVGAGDSPIAGPRLKPFDEGAGVIEFGAPESRDEDEYGLAPESEPETDDAVADASGKVASSVSEPAFDWRKHSRPCLSSPVECDAIVDTSDIDEEDDIVAECELESGANDHDSAFEEEVVFDRYAALDADKERTIVPGKFGSRPSPEKIIDAVGPMIDELLDTGWDEGHDDFDLPLPAQNQSLERTRLYYETEGDESAEERIGASVIDTCLETYEAIFGRKAGAAAVTRFDDVSPEQNRGVCDRPGTSEFGEERDTVEYDIVEPETDGSTPPKKPRNGKREMPEKADAPGQSNRQCQQLFTELRRRRNG